MCGWIILSEIGWSGMDWIGLAQEESSCESGNELSVSEKCWKVLE
jgi:hypothetical protein